MLNQRRQIQYRIFSLLEGANHSIWGKLFSLTIVALILLNTFAMMFFSMGALGSVYEQPILYFEIFCIVLFTYEYGLRLWSCTVLPRYRHPLRGRLRFMITPLVLIDLLVLIPFYLPVFYSELIIAHSLIFARLFRVLRFLRILKLIRYSRSAMILARVFYAKREELLVTFMLMLLVLIVVSNLVFLAEYNAEPRMFKTVPDALWWGIVTLSTVGYGDVYPVTAFGRILGSIVSLLGVAIFALPAGILAAGFQEEMYRRNHIEIHECPHCGKPILPSELKTKSLDKRH